MFPVYPQIVQDVQPNSPAVAAGVKSGDEIIRVNGVDLRTSGRTLQQTIQQMPEKTFPITVFAWRTQRRIRRQQDGSRTPGHAELKDGRKMIGIDIQFPSCPRQAWRRRLRSRNPFRATKKTRF